MKEYLFDHREFWEYENPLAFAFASLLKMLTLYGVCTSVIFFTVVGIALLAGIFS